MLIKFERSFIAKMYYLYKDEPVERLAETEYEYELYFYKSSPKRRWVKKYTPEGTHIPLEVVPEDIKNVKGDSYSYTTYKTKPYEHQLQFLEYAKYHDKMLLLDEPGLGKTKQSLDLIANRIENGQIKRALIICGVASLQYNWLDEVKKHTDLKGYILGTRAVGKSGIRTRIGSGADKVNDLKRITSIPAQVFITNIETLRNNNIVDELQRCIKCGIIEQVVVDEIHRCKNPKTKQTAGLLSLNPQYKLGLTGTPVVNSPIDLYPMMKWMGRTVPPISHFRDKYCIMGGFQGKEITGYKNIQELSTDIQYWTLRRTKAECLDLPEKTVETIRVDMLPEQLKLYKEIQKDLRERMEEIQASPSPMGQMVGLRKAVDCPPLVLPTFSGECCAKLEVLLDIVDQLVSSGQKVVIFTWFVFTLQYLNTILRRHGYVPALMYGDLSQETREVNKKAFQENPDCKIIIGNYATMGTGITLTASSHIIEYELPWTAADEDQAQDRCHRIGQYNPVNVIRLITNNSIDEVNEQIVDGKAVLSENILSKSSQNKLVNMILDINI